MNEKTGVIAQAVFQSAVAIVCTLLIGLMFNGWDIFRYRGSAFVFVEYGIIGSVFFFSLKASVRASFIALFALLVLNCILVTRSFSSIFFIRDLAFFVMVSAVVYLHFTFVHRPRRMDRRIQPIVLGVLMAVGFLAAVLSLHIVRGVVLSFEDIGEMVLPVMQNGFLIGLGIGLGCLLVEMERVQKILRSPESH